MMLAHTVTGAMLISRIGHRDMNKLIFTHCTANKKLMQETVDEVDLS